MIKNPEEIAFTIDIKEPFFFRWRTGTHIQNHKLLSIYINCFGCEVGFLSMNLDDLSINSIGWDFYEEFISYGNNLNGIKENEL